MTRRLAAALGALALAASPALAQEPVKIGLIMAYSGQFADASKQMDNAVKLYVQKHGDTVAGRKIEFIAGFVITPEALSVADLSAEAKKLMVVMNAATSVITTRSPYIVRTSVTVPQLNEA